jgi:hypothetical protein
MVTLRGNTQISAYVISLDRLLGRYGPEARDIRELLRRYTEAKLRDLFPESSNRAPNLENSATISSLEELQNKVLALTPTNDTQRWLQAQALQLTSSMMAARGQESPTLAVRVPLVF